MIRTSRHGWGLLILRQTKSSSCLTSTHTFTVGTRSMPDLAAWIGNSTQVSGVPQRVEDQGTLMDAARMISASMPRRSVPGRTAIDASRALKRPA